MAHVLISDENAATLQRSSRHVQEALEIYRGIHGAGDHPDIAECLHRLATLDEQLDDLSSGTAVPRPGRSSPCHERAAGGRVRTRQRAFTGWNWS